MYTKCITLIVSSAICLLSSCGVTYQNPPKSPTTAQVKNVNHRSGIYTWSNFIVESVDNQPVDYTFALTGTTKKIYLTQGTHNLVIKGMFNQNIFSGGPFEARADVPMNFQAGKTYKTAGRVEGSRLAMWLIDADTGKRVTPMAKVPYHAAPKVTYYYY